MTKLRTIPGIPKSCQDYLLSILYHLILPLLPLIIEYWITAEVKESSLMLVASLYSVSIGASSRNRLLFGISILIGILFAVAFGVLSSGTAQLPHCKVFGYVCIISIFCIHALERYNMHIIEGLSYWRFYSNGAS